jgi:hypothetical protein
MAWQTRLSESDLEILVPLWQVDHPWQLYHGLPGPPTPLDDFGLLGRVRFPHWWALRHITVEISLVPTHQ